MRWADAELSIGWNKDRCGKEAFPTLNTLLQGSLLVLLVTEWIGQSNKMSSTYRNWQLCFLSRLFLEHYAI